MIEDLQGIIKILEEEKRYKIGIYIPGSLSDYTRQLLSVLEKTMEDRVRLIKVSDTFLNSYEGMKLIDVLVILEGERVSSYYLPRVKNFLSRGGAIVIFSKNFPFMNLEEFQNRNGLTAYILKDATDMDEFYRRTTAYMGVKCYTSDVRPIKAVLDKDFLKGSLEEIITELTGNGIYCNTSSEKYIPYPPYGNVFPERYEVLRNYIVLKGVDKFGKHLTSSIVFTQNWENGSRSAFIIGLEDIEVIKEFIPDIIDFCLNKVFIASLEPNYACYRDGEEVKVKCKIISFSDFLVNTVLSLEIEGETGDRILEVRDLRIRPKDILNEEICWIPREFPSDFYTIKAKLIIDGKIVSKAENGFVVWKDEVAYNSKNKLDIQGRYFLHNGKSTAITGTNYYESHIGELMWIRPNIKKLRDDLKAMADSGINYIRIHYHHAKWFIDYLKYSINQISSYFGEVNQSYLPDERTWRILDAHIYLCQKFGIVYGGDLLTLVPEEMGDPTGWIGVQDRIYLDEKMKAQKEFLKLLARRYRNVQGIAWDLWNEPEELDAKKVLRWAKEMKEVLRENGDKHLITIGTGRTSEYEEVVDFHSDHRNFKDILQTRYDTPKPVIMQEVWLDRPQTLEGDREQAKDMFQALLDTFRIGLSGFSPWQWTNQARLWNDYRVTWHELWDDRLGCCVRNDGTLKPAGRVYRDFSILLKSLNFLQYKDGLIYTDKGILKISSGGENTDFGTVYLVHYNQTSSSLYAGIMKDAVKIKDKVYISAEDNTIWFFTGDNRDILQSDEFYIKTNIEGTLKMFQEIGRRVLNLELVDYTSNGWKFLSTIEFSKDKDFIEIPILPWYVNYWLRVKI